MKPSEQVYVGRSSESDHAARGWGLLAFIAQSRPAPNITSLCPFLCRSSGNVGSWTRIQEQTYLASTYFTAFTATQMRTRLVKLSCSVWVKWVIASGLWATCLSGREMGVHAWGRMQISFIRRGCAADGLRSDIWLGGQARGSQPGLWYGGRYPSQDAQRARRQSQPNTRPRRCVWRDRSRSSARSYRSRNRRLINT